MFFFYAFLFLIGKLKSGKIRLSVGATKKLLYFFEGRFPEGRITIKENCNTCGLMGFSKLKGVIIAIISKRDVSMRLLLVLVVPLSRLPLPGYLLQLAVLHSLVLQGRGGDVFRLQLPGLLLEKWTGLRLRALLGNNVRSGVADPLLRQKEAFVSQLRGSERDVIFLV